LENQATKVAETATVRGKREAKRLRTQDVICRAAIACLYDAGYAETSINCVVARAGVSKGALQHHFPTKEDLIITVAERLIERAIEVQHVSATAEPRGDDVAEYLRGTWNSLINTRSYQALLEILNAARTDHNLRARLLPRLQQWNRDLGHWVVKLFEPVGPHGQDVQMIMVMSRCLMRGLVIQRLFETDPTFADRLVERWIEIVSPLLRPREPS